MRLAVELNVSEAVPEGTQIGEPIPGEETLNGHDKPLTVRSDGLQKRFWEGLARLMSLTAGGDRGSVGLVARANASSGSDYSDSASGRAQSGAPSYAGTADIAIVAI